MVECGKVADPLDLDVGQGIGGERLVIVCVIALPQKGCPNPIATFHLHRGENPPACRQSGHRVPRDQVAR